MTPGEPGDPLFQCVRDFVCESTGAAPEGVTEATSLQRDLGVEGDDAGEFIIAFAERFGVDLDRFDFEAHFDVEGGFDPVRYLFLKAFRPKKLHKAPVTVSDLVRAARARQWP